MTQKNEIEKVFNHFYPGFMSFSERMIDPASKNTKKEISPEVFMNALTSAFNLGVQMSADNALIKRTFMTGASYEAKQIGSAEGDNYKISEDSILKLLIK